MLPGSATADVVIASKNYVDSIVSMLLDDQSDWNQSDSTKPDYIKNKPSFDSYIPTSQKAAASGVASLGTDAKVPIAQLAIGTNATSVAIGNDERFDSIPVGAPGIGAPAGRALIWIEP